MRALLTVLAVVLALVVPGTAAAAPPANDDFANARIVDPADLPFTDVVSNVEATTEVDEPTFSCTSSARSVWYAITPTTAGLYRASMAGSSFFDVMLRVYRGDGTGFPGLSFIGCASPFWNGQNELTFTVDAGETYYVQASVVFGSGDSRLRLEYVLPPSNDDFANAEVASALPFGDDVDTTAATVESGEPALCTPPQSERTAWYTFTPTVSGSLTARVTSAPAPTGVAAYTGASLGALTLVGCQYGSPLTFHVDAGTTYYLQIGVFGQSGGLLHFVLEVPPSPTVGFFYSPGDPTVFDTAQFFDSGTFDPAGAGIASEAWDFGDGGTASGCCPSHRFLADDDYVVTLTATTPDGRSASTSRTIQVRTHDVTIAKLSVPQSATVGQTRQLSVGVSNKRYAENVQVQLFKSGPGGFQLVGTLTQSVPVRGGGRTTEFKYSYTFTSDDAALGKVTFKAVASIVAARDALPTDNEVIALPTKVG